MGVYDVDLSEDLLVCVGLDSFVLKVEGAADVTLSECVMTEPVDTHEQEPSDGQAPQMDQIMVWPRSRSAKPPLGSVLVDDEDTYWTILNVRRKQHVETWETHCRNLSIVPSISNQVTLLKAVYGKGRANEARAQWQGLFSGEKPATDEDVIEARLQPAMELAQIRYGAEWARQGYRLIMKQPLDIDLAGGQYRVVDASGNRYRILELFQECRLDRYPVAMLVRIIEGREYVVAGTPSPLPAPTFPTP